MTIILKISTKFNNNLAIKIESNQAAENCFECLLGIFQSSVDETCKLAVPKTTKRNYINNPWITPIISKSIIINDELYRKWIDSLKVIEGVEIPSIPRRQSQQFIRDYRSGPTHQNEDHTSSSPHSQRHL